MKLTEDQIKRYSRQIVLKEVGGIGQVKLLNSKISVVGLGALGSPITYYLAAAGIGRLQLIDYDTVEISNLHRQILHFTKDIGEKKTVSSLEKINQLNPDCKIELISERITKNNSIELLKDSDFVIEGSDNLQTKMLINDTCIHLKIPFTIAGVLRFHGQLITVVPEEKTACYRCVFGESIQGDSSMSCSQAGVIGFVPGILGCLEANEAIKHILNIGTLIKNKILYVDLLENSFDFINVTHDENCIACGTNAKNLLDYFNYGDDDSCEL
ncbi:MAG: ThiF family adenylyltransferase [Candidatus Thorarchaeota archaeon]